MRTLEIYGRPGCMPCSKAKQLAKEKDYRFLFSDVTAPIHRKALARRLPDAKTVPQIFAGEIHIGGFDDMARMQADGSLARILGH